jgi:hypothetical protein
MTVLEQNAYNAIIAMAKKDEPDYWTKLEHQYAGMAMQAILLFYGNAKVDDDYCAEEAKYYAHTLVEKMRQKEE